MPGDRIAYLGLNSDRFHEYYLAAFWAGAVVNPVNTRWSASEIAYSLQDSGSSILFADETLLPRLEEVQAKSPGLRRIVWLGTSEPPADAIDYRSEERRVGKECVSTCRYRWSRYH